MVMPNAFGVEPARLMAGEYPPQGLLGCQRDVNQRPKPTATRKPETGSHSAGYGLAGNRRNHLRRNGKEGVQRFSPSEGFCEKGLVIRPGDEAAVST